MAEKTKLDKALDLKAKYEALMDEARNEALEAIEAHLAELRNLGFQYEVVESNRFRGFTHAPTKKQRICKTCGLPGHNSRSCTQRGVAQPVDVQ